MKNIEKIIGIAMLLFAVGFNLWLYRLEPTAKIDPNDNTFQFALVERTNQIWDFVSQRPISRWLTLFDHWVPNWNEGYNIPFYYSHLPQIAIVAAYRFLSLFTIHYSLFSFYHLVIYFLLSLFPLSMFLAMRITGFSWVAAGFSALLASHLSTDGLYGLDPASFLWRGYGLSSQLFAMMFLPLFIASAYRKKILPAILFLVLTTAGHLGIGIMAFLSLIPLLYRHPKKMIGIALPAIALLAYWIVPALLADNYHNFSFWDPVWKFNSYGAKEVMARLFNGDLFDFGRLPIFTGLVLVGALLNPAFALLLLFWLFLYFGRTSWGPLIDLIPVMREFHLSRFIVGVHAAGLFLAPIGLSWIMDKITSARLRLTGWIHTSVSLVLGILLLIPVYQQTIRYNELNETLIARANDNFARQSPDIDALVTALQELPPGRVYSGRGGGWGKDFRIAETNVTMYLGNFGLPTVLWMPETWSPNGDTEQYFREDKPEDYDLYNVRYVAAPPSQPPQPFWKILKKNPSWTLYEVQTSGYFSVGVRPAIVAADKYSRTNVVRLWIQSDDPKNGLYPELTFETGTYPKNTGLPNFKMLDEVTFQTPDESTHNLFAEPPHYISPISPISPIPLISLISQSSDSDMIFRTSVEVPEGCTECLVILKQTFHPNWHVTVDGKRIDPIITFPFFIGIPVTAGTHEIIASYEPSRLKIFLFIISGVLLFGLFIFFGKLSRTSRNG